MKRSFWTNIASQSVLNIIDESSSSGFSVLPDLGGCINNLVLNGKSILTGASNGSELKKHTIDAFADAQLFPYHNRIKEGKYTLSGNQFQLQVNDAPFNNSIHGLIYNQNFKPEIIDAENAEIVLSYLYQKLNNGYPYNVKITNSFQLSGLSFSITTSIENIENKQIPFAHGWHPYFAANNGVDNFLLQINGDEIFEIDENLIPTGKVIHRNEFMTPAKIGNRQLNDCYRMKNPNNPLIATLEDTENNLKVFVIKKDIPFCKCIFHLTENQSLSNLKHAYPMPLIILLV